MARSESGRSSRWRWRDEPKTRFRLLSRTAFSTSRVLDFLSARELTFQCGYSQEDWPLVIVKELVDNALDACEEQGIAPEITVTGDSTGHHGRRQRRRHPAAVVDRLLDFSIRVSSREAYVAPDRGAQGNALKTVVAMPFVLSSGKSGRVDIAGGGVLRRDRSSTCDRIRQQPQRPRSSMRTRKDRRSCAMSLAARD